MRSRSSKAHIGHLASTQYGVVSRHQALTAGLSGSRLDRMVQSGELIPLYPGVYLVVGSEVTARTHVKAATLWAGPDAAASHRTAASLWTLPVAPLNQIEITTPRRVTRKGVAVHRRALEACDRTVLSGIAVTSIHRTLLDLAESCATHEIQDALDAALRRGLTSHDWLLKQIDRVGTRARRGPAGLKRLIEDEREPPPSWLERRFIRLLANRLPPHIREHHVCRYHLDFAWPEAMLAVEVHGAKWHLSRRQWRNDLTRHNELTAMGWTVLHFNWDQIKEDPEGVVTEILKTYDRLMHRALEI